MSAEGGAVLIPLVAGVIAVGVVAQVLSARLRVPSVVFLIAAGIVLGPEVLGVLDPDAFGTSLSAIVGLSVAIIVFEGAFHLELSTLREAPTSALRLVTVGAAASLVGTAVAVRFALGAPWDVSFLVGALLIATGPTVIAPILEVVPARDQVKAVLNIEGIVNDVTAAILALVLFKAVLRDVTVPRALVTLFAERLGVGVIVGVAVAAVLYYLLTRVDLSAGNAPQLARLLVLAGALVAYGFAEALLSEAGIAAAATAGVLLGNADLPYEEAITDFKGDVTLIVLSFVFIALAALLEFDTLLGLGVGGIVVVLAVTLLVRPAMVFACTVGDRFTVEERVFMGLIGPRGIIPASVATLFAIRLREAGQTGAADVLVGTVFLVILATVVFEGGLARRLAVYLDVIPMRFIIVGGGSVGRSLAGRLADRGENVVLIEKDKAAVERARELGFSVHHGDGTDVEALRTAGVENARTVVAATGDDDANLLAAQLSRSTFDVTNVLSRVNNPDNVEAFEELGVPTVSGTEATALALDHIIERPALSQWLDGFGEEGDARETVLRNAAFDGRTVAEVGPELPGDCLIALVSRDAETRVPGAGVTLQLGDRLTILGDVEAVETAVGLLSE